MPRADLGSKLILFAQDLTETRTVAQLIETVRSAIMPVGLNAASCAMVSGPSITPSRRFLFLDWPDYWMGVYREERFLDIDPIPKWALGSGHAASFTEVASRLPQRDPGRRVVDAARSNHFGEGFLLPIRFPNKSLGIVSLGGERDRLDQAECAYLEIVSYAVFLRAAALERNDMNVVDIKLTARELDCIHLLVRGLTDREIAAALSISEPTVRFHLAAARRKTGARSRTHLAASAVWLSLSRL